MKQQWDEASTRRGGGGVGGGESPKVTMNHDTPIETKAKTRKKEPQFAVDIWYKMMTTPKSGGIIYNNCLSKKNNLQQLEETL